MTQPRRDESWIIAYVLGLAASAPAADEEGRAVHVARLRAAVDDDRAVLRRARQHLRQDPPADPALARDAERLLTAATAADEPLTAGPPYRPGDAVIVTSDGRQRSAEVVAVIETGALDPQRRWRVLYRWDDAAHRAPPVHCGDDGHGQFLEPAPQVVTDIEQGPQGGEDRSDATPLEGASSA